MAERKAFLLRISPALWEAMERWAADELRSVNGQVEYLLARAVREAGRDRGRRSGREKKGPGRESGPAGPESSGE